MRILFVLLFFSNISLAQFYLPSYGNSVAKNNLIVNYDFTNATSFNGTGSTVNSINGTNIPAYIYRSPIFFSDPGYLRFTAANSQYMLIGDLQNFYSKISSTSRTGVFTVSLWFNPTATNGVVLSDLGQTSINSNYHTSDIEMVGGYLKFSVWPKDAIITTSSVVSLNKWHHVILTYTGTKIVAYLDGSLVGSSSYAREGPSMRSLTSAQYFGVAANDGTNMGSGAYGSFLLANFKYYSEALGEAEVSRLYNEEKSNFDLVLMFDGGNTYSYSGSGTNINDISGAVKTGVHNSSNSVIYNASAGGNLYYNAGYTDFNFDLNGSNCVTVEMWAKLVNMNSGMLFGFYSYDVWANTNLLGFNTGASDLYGLNSNQTSGFVNNWKHYTFVMNASSVNTNKIYINGVQQTLAQQLASPNNSVANFNNGIGRIGGWKINSGFLQSMYLTTFKVYNRELTSSEIQDKFNKTKARHGL